MQTNVTEDYLNALQNEISAFEEKVLGGGCSSYEEYLGHIRYIRGIEVSRALLQDTLKKSLSTVSIEENEMKFNEDLNIDEAEQMVEDDELDMDLMKQIYPGMAG